MHVSVVATVTQPERVVSRVTNTFTFVFAVDLASAASAPAVRTCQQEGNNFGRFIGSFFALGC